MVKKIKNWSKSKLIRIIKKEVQKSRKLRYKSNKCDLLLSELLEEYNKRYLY